MTEVRAARLTCREVVERASDYLEDALTAVERARVEAHLEICPGCTAYVAQLRATIGAIGRLRDDDVPVRLRKQLSAAFRGRRRR